jgi:hypothetical protein
MCSWGWELSRPSRCPGKTAWRYRPLREECRSSPSQHGMTTLFWCIFSTESRRPAGCFQLAEIKRELGHRKGTHQAGTAPIRSALYALPLHTVVMQGVGSGVLCLVDREDTRRSPEHSPTFPAGPRGGIKKATGVGAEEPRLAVTRPLSPVCLCQPRPASGYGV